MELQREAFLSIAKSFGLDVHDPHIEELYTYVQKTLPILKCIEDLDLKDLEPAWPLTTLLQTKPQQSTSPRGKGERVKIREASHKSDELIYLSTSQLGRLIKKKKYLL
jgi:hypothetical protein